MSESLLVLGIETSCDETAAAIVQGDRRILANVISSQVDTHAPYHGVVPELAARSHVEHLDRVIGQALTRAGVGFGDLDGVAATAGPGLLGGVLVGSVTAKCIGLVHALPYVGINHLEAHLLTARLTGSVDFPFLALLVSGGHSQFVSASALGTYGILGGTLDDAAGEAFDKAARLLGLGFPGGPAIEAAARQGDPDRFDLPRPLLGRPGCDLSFSGLKTALLHRVQSFDPAGPDRDTTRDLAASFQAAVADVLTDRLGEAAAAFRDRHPDGTSFVLAGGVAANEVLRHRLHHAAGRFGLFLEVPPANLCTDNAAMVAWAGVEHLRAGRSTPLEAPARARWPLGEHPA